MTEKDRYIPQPIKDKLLVDAMHRCCLCPQHEDITDLHHIVPISEKGPNTEDNLMVVCPTCHAKIHRIRGRYTVKQLRMYKERWVERCKGIPLEALLPSLHNQTPPEPNFVGRVEMLKTIIEWYNDPEVRIGALIGWGGVGKSALVRKWYDSLEENKIQPDGIFWWGFYRNAFLDQFLNALLRYVSQGEIDPDSIKSTWEKTDRIKEYISQGTYLIILDGLEQMQKPESGDEFGKMSHRECTEFLHYLADAPKTGLCLITTRYPLKDLDNWCDDSYRTLPLVDLSVPDAIAMLRKRGVKGEDEELKEVVDKYKGHALSLTSVAGYLKRYYYGDIRHAPDIKFVFSDEERFKDVNKLLRRYAEKMSKSELSFLNIFSLFRKEVTDKEFNGVFRHKIEGTRFNDDLVKMGALDFKDLVGGLVEWRLISFDKDKGSYTTHPLIKTYFESHFDAKDRKLCHKRIYHYFGEHAPERPETLDQMAPLFEQVYHGCSAGLYDKVYEKVYQEKIEYREECYLTEKLGAWETDLSLVRTFFPKGDLSKMPLVIKKSIQSWLLNSAGLTLLYIGRPKEAKEPFMTAIKMRIKDEEWKTACISYRNLSTSQFRIGKIVKARKNAENSLKMAKKSKDKFLIARSKAYFGYILFLLGDTGNAEKLFKEQNEIYKEIWPNAHASFNHSSILYAELLIRLFKTDDAFALITANLNRYTENNRQPDISYCHRLLACIERIKENYKKSKEHI